MLSTIGFFRGETFPARSSISRTDAGHKTRMYDFWQGKTLREEEQLRKYIDIIMQENL